MKITGNEPALPQVFHHSNNQNGNAIYESTSGLTIRQEFAKTFMATMMMEESPTTEYWFHAKEAIKAADALIRELNKPERQ